MTKKLTYFIAVILLLSTGITSCNSGKEKQIEDDLTKLGAYMDSVKTATSVYTEERWEKIKAEYNSTIEKIGGADEKLSADASAKLESVKAEYNKLKDDFDSHFREAKEQQAANSYKVTLRKALFGDDNIGSDMKFDFVTAKNALPVYDRFVTTVKNNQNNYSREDWDEIKLLYEALDNRKNEIEKDLSTSDNLKIAKLKVQFAAIKSVKRPAAKVEENEDAKK